MPHKPRWWAVLCAAAVAPTNECRFYFIFYLFAIFSHLYRVHFRAATVGMHLWNEKRYAKVDRFVCVCLRLCESARQISFIWIHTAHCLCIIGEKAHFYSSFAFSRRFFVRSLFFPLLDDVGSVLACCCTSLSHQHWSLCYLVFFCVAASSTRWCASAETLSVIAPMMRMFNCSSGSGGTCCAAQK